ncbi:MAG TPA: hypothetical protein VNK05_14035 [Chloroflexota bacterium]|nr:hypothetical protein [Chloroflexota bacterium]
MSGGNDQEERCVGTLAVRSGGNLEAPLDAGWRRRATDCATEFRPDSCCSWL